MRINWGTSPTSRHHAFCAMVGRRYCGNPVEAEVCAEVTQVLNGRKTATFFQLDRRISMMIDLQLASKLPIVQAQE